MQPKLEITSQKAQIEIITHRPTVEITRSRPQLRVKRTPAQMRIDKQMPVMRLDRSAQWHALQIGPVLEMARSYYLSSFNKGLEAIGRIAGEGDALMRIESGTNALADLAAQRSTGSEGEMVFSALPPPQVQWDPGHFRIDWSQHQLELQWDVSTKADIRVEPGYVEIRVKKHPEVIIRVQYDEKNLIKNKASVDKYV